MKIYRLDSLEEYKIFVREASENDQPVYIYASVDNPHVVCLSHKEIVDPDAEINKLTKILNDDILDDDEPLFDDDDEFDDPLLLIL